jgi:hypothetical protein
MHRAFIPLLFFSIASCNTNSSVQKPIPPEEQNKEISLEKTNWNSQFYHYSNFYHFETDEAGYSDDGQVAWSCPIDLKAQKIRGNKILYAGQVQFHYQIEKDTLTIDYLYKDADHSKSRVFTYRKKYKDWISVNSYTYGFEVLKQGEQKLDFEETNLIQ